MADDPYRDERNARYIEAGNALAKACDEAEPHILKLIETARAGFEVCAPTIPEAGQSAVVVRSVYLDWLEQLRMHAEVLRS